MKRLYLLSGVLLILFLSGCSLYKVKTADTDDKGKLLASDTDADIEQTKGTVTATEEATEDMTLLRNYDECPNKMYSWYIVRDNNHGMSGCDNSFEIEQYDAYYVDAEANHKNEKVMYLTFDCGYDNGYTEKMLDVLKKHNAKACFFVTMTYIRDNVDIVKRMKEEGHIVGNHTVSHPTLPEISVEEQKKELKECADYMKEATGYEMDMYFRPPSGEYSERTLQLAKDMGYKTIFWSMAYLDYDVNKQPGEDYVRDHFKKYYHNGAIPLLHNVSESNANALDDVLTYLTNEGYRFGSLDEMFEK